MFREMDDEVVIAWTTFPADQDPAPFARALVEERLAACVTTQTGLQSVYRWNDGVETAPEYQLTIKTTNANLGRLERRVSELHPYDVPEFLVTPPLTGSGAYVDWVAASTSQPR